METTFSHRILISNWMRTKFYFNMHDTIWDIQEAIRHEKSAKEKIDKSCKKWEEIVSNISTGVTNISTSSHEWQIRFECQYQYNKVLMKDIQRMQTEIRMLRNGRYPGPNYEEMKTLKTVGDWRKKTKDLNVEKWSMKSLQNMYETQLDSEAMTYYKARDDLYKLTNDVRNSFGTRIHELEKADNDLTVSIKTSQRKLKPIAKVPPIKSLPLMNRENQNYAAMFHRQHNAEEERVQTTFSGLLPVAEIADNNITSRRN